MSRIAKAPVTIPAGVEVSVNGNDVTVKGAKASLTKNFNEAVMVSVEDGQVICAPVEGVVKGWAQAGTARSIINNMVAGVTDGFEKKLELVGVGYRAATR
ncbi:50S ribosomal subunit protein L6 (fragment) [uncultured Thiomicrorhabdus sp.]